MTKFNASIVTAVAALFVAGGAFGATLQPAAGNLPFVDQPVAASGTLTRSAVEAQAAADEPAAGEFSSWAQPVAIGELTRHAVEAEAATHEPTAGEL